MLLIVQVTHRTFFNFTCRTPKTCNNIDDRLVIETNAISASRRSCFTCISQARKSRIHRKHCIEHPTSQRTPRVYHDTLTVQSLPTRAITIRPHQCSPDSITFRAQSNRSFSRNPRRAFRAEAQPSRYPHQLHQYAEVPGPSL